MRSIGPTNIATPNPTTYIDVIIVPACTISNQAENALVHGSRNPMKALGCDNRTHLNANGRKANDVMEKKTNANNASEDSSRLPRTTAEKTIAFKDTDVSTRFHSLMTLDFDPLFSSHSSIVDRRRFTNP
jgi:hypothetical protein